MNEDFATREWGQHHELVSKGVADAAHAIMESLRVLQAKQYDAPWRQSAPCRDAAKC